MMWLFLNLITVIIKALIASNHLIENRNVYVSSVNGRIDRNYNKIYLVFLSNKSVWYIQKTSVF